MKAAQINKYGGGEVVEINNNTPDPVVAEGKVLVQVYAAGVNPIDWKMREGYVKDRAPLDFPITLGGDFAGVIKEVGEGVFGFKVGDEVYGQAGLLNNGSGSFAEMAVADIQKVAMRPRTLTYIETASLPLAGVSALQGIAEHIQAAPVKKILIHGGAGGIGAAAIQIAKHLGAYVAATASAQDMDYVKSLGANEVIDYASQSFEDIVRDYDGVFDASGSGTETYEKSFRVVKKGGAVVSMTEQPREDLAEQYGVTTLRQSTDVTSQRLAKLTEFVEQGVLKIDIDKTFSLDQAAEALTYLQTKHSRGKVVLQMR
jgi:alcohol dehydrogenase